MLKFHGSLEEFKNLINSCGFDGEWTQHTTMHQFKCINGGMINFYTNKTIQFQGSSIGKFDLENVITSAIGSRLGQSNIDISEIASAGALVKGIKKNNEKVFVVYGHDTTAREQLELVLIKLGLDPFVLSNTSGSGLTIIEALEETIVDKDSKCKFGIVLMTPDDLGYSKSDGIEKVEPRARQNVVLEMGMLLSALGRKNVAILKKGHLEVPSDAHGILYIPFNDHIKEAVPKLVGRLTEAGFEIKPECITKASF